MSSICLIACCAAKAADPCAARQLYISDLFRKSLRWAQMGSRFHTIQVLSAKYGLVDLDAVIEPYDMTLNAFDIEQRRAWAARVADQLLARFGTLGHSVTALAGRRYTDELSTRLNEIAPAIKFLRPMKGLGIGMQKAWLVRELAAGAALR